MPSSTPLFKKKGKEEEEDSKPSREDEEEDVETTCKSRSRQSIASRVSRSIHPSFLPLFPWASTEREEPRIASPNNTSKAA